MTTSKGDGVGGARAWNKQRRNMGALHFVQDEDDWIPGDDVKQMFDSLLVDVYFDGVARAPFRVALPLTVLGSTVISFSLASTSAGTSFW
jgi:NADPH:quinone reductase-like Zn-dependent oxidoreductase